MMIRIVPSIAPLLERIGLRGSPAESEGSNARAATARAEQRQGPKQGGFTE